MIHITTGTTTISTSSPRGILIQNNAALTGTLTLADSIGTQAVITNPAVGNQFLYYGLSGTVTIAASATCDISVSILNNKG